MLVVVGCGCDFCGGVGYCVDLFDVVCVVDVVGGIQGDFAISDWDKALDEMSALTAEKSDRKSTRLNSSHRSLSRMPSSA